MGELDFVNHLSDGGAAVARKHGIIRSSIAGGNNGTEGYRF